MYIFAVIFKCFASITFVLFKYILALSFSAQFTFLSRLLSQYYPVTLISYMVLFRTSLLKLFNITHTRSY